MKAYIWIKRTLIIHILMFVCSNIFAAEDLYKQARGLQREGKYAEAIEAYEAYLTRPLEVKDLKDGQLATYTDALVQLMNNYQSKGEPEACISALQDVFQAAPILQHELLRDYSSVLGYALSRTERMAEAETTMLKALTLPLYSSTPERYFRDYAYAAAVFYSNPDYQKEVINWCLEAMQQAQLSENTSGKQWVTAMLGSLYKREGNPRGT